MTPAITSGFLKGRQFSVLGNKIRPTETKVRSAIFDTLFSIIDFDDKIFCDVFAGSGAVGFEAVSRGFKRTVFVEKLRPHTNKIKAVAKDFNVEEQIEIINFDAFFLLSVDSIFISDVFFFDPPYNLVSNFIPVFKKFLLSDSLKKDAIVIMESGEPLNLFFDSFKVKEKKYGKTFVTFFRKV